MIRHFSFIFIFLVSQTSHADFLALGCKISLPQCYWLDTREHDAAFRFRCTEPIQNPMGLINYYPDSDPRSSYSVKVTTVFLSEVGGIRVESASFEDEHGPLDVEYIYLTRNGGLLALGGAATELLDEVVKSCLENPVP